MQTKEMELAWAEQQIQCCNALVTDLKNSLQQRDSELETMVT